MGSQITKVEVGERAGSALELVVRSTTFCVCGSSTSGCLSQPFAIGQCSCGKKPGSCPFQSRLAESHRCLDLQCIATGWLQWLSLKGRPLRGMPCLGLELHPWKDSPHPPFSFLDQGGDGRYFLLILPSRSSKPSTLPSHTPQLLEERSCPGPSSERMGACLGGQGECHICCSPGL